MLGHNLVRELLDQGWDVAGLVRSEAKAQALFDDLPIDVVIGDMLDIEAFSEQLVGVDVVFHTAAYFREYYGDGDHWAKLAAVNIDGTVKLARAAHAAGVALFVDTCSGGIIKSREDAPADEDDVAEPEDLENLYFRSKVLAERELRDFMDASGMKIQWVLPGWMFGPRDAAPTAAGEFVQDFLAGKFPVVLPGNISVVDARDVARAMISMVDRGRSGERYLVAGRRTTLREIVDGLAKVAGVRSPKITLPYAVALPFAWAVETGTRLTGGTNVLTVKGLKTLNSTGSVTSAKAESELGATFRPLEETLRDVVSWYAARGEVHAPALA